MRTDKKYTEISEEMRERLEEMLCCCAVREFRKEEVEQGYHKYEVVLQIYKFITYMMEEELKQSAKLTIDLIEEMKKSIILVWTNRRLNVWLKR